MVEWWLPVQRNNVFSGGSTSPTEANALRPAKHKYGGQDAKIC